MARSESNGRADAAQDAGTDLAEDRAGPGDPLVGLTLTVRGALTVATGVLVVAASESRPPLEVAGIAAACLVVFILFERFAMRALYRRIARRIDDPS